MNKPSILLVEDNLKLAAYLKEFLTQAGYRVRQQSRGDKAVYQIIKDQPDLVILDVMLPGLNGIQVCQTVRESYTGIILMLTALGDNTDQIAGLTQGADDYIIKPVDPEVLLARLQALQRRPRPKNSPEKLEFGLLTVNIVQHQVNLADAIIDLKPAEFELLAFLAKNADHVVNRENITQALRGTHYDGFDRSIDLRISYLRKKLYDNIENPHRIKTVHGKGYIFISTAWHHPP